MGKRGPRRVLIRMASSVSLVCLVTAPTINTTSTLNSRQIVPTNGTTEQLQTKTSVSFSKWATHSQSGQASNSLSVLHLMKTDTMTSCLFRALTPSKLLVHPRLRLMPETTQHSRATCTFMMHPILL